MFLVWVCFGILISNIILSNQLSLPAITTSTKCAIENQKIQGFSPSQFFQCVRKDNKLYFEARYCPSVKNTFYETEQRCLPNIGGGEVRCLIPGKRCSHNKLGPMAYPNKFKPNYYIVCLPKATHICRCYGNAIYDASTEMCRIISTTTDMGRDDSNGIIPKLNCERSGIHSTVELEHPDKQKCVLFCNQKYRNKQFELNIICARKTNLVDANVPIINPIDIDSVINSEENISPEIKKLIVEEFLNSTNSYDNLGWPLEKSTTKNSQAEHITSTPIGETVLGSSSSEDASTTSSTDKNIKERPFDPFSFKYDETTSEKIVLTSLPTENDSDTSHTFNERATSIQLYGFSPTEGEPDVRTTEKVTSQDGSVQWNSDQIFIPFLTDDGTRPGSEKSSLPSSTLQDGFTQSVTNQNFKESTINIPLSTTEYGRVQSITQGTSSSLFSVTENGSTQMSIDNNFNETTFSPLSFITKQKTTDPPEKIVTTVSHTTEDGSTKWNINQNTKEISSSSEFLTIEDIIKTSSEKTTLTSFIPEKENTQRTTDQYSQKSTVNTLSPIMETETTNQLSENLSLANVISEGGSTPSIAYQNFIETSSTPLSTTDDAAKRTNPDTILLITEEETNPARTITTSVSYTTEGSSTKWTTNWNTIETSSSSQYLATEDITKSSHGQTSLASSVLKDEDTHWPKNQNFKNSSANNLPTIMETETTNQFTENILLANVMSEEGSTPSTTYQTFIETSSTPLSTTDDSPKETNSETILLITEEETTNPAETIATSISYITEDKSIKWTTNQNNKETSSSSEFLATEDIRLQTSTPLLTTDNAPKGTTFDTRLLTTKEEITNPAKTISISESYTTEDIRLQTSTPLLTTYDTPIVTNSDTILLTTEEETTNPVKTITTSESFTTEDRSTKWTTNQNTIETSSSSQFLVTDDIRLQTSTPFSTTDDTPKVINSDPILLITEEETTNPGKAMTTSESYTTEDRSTKSTTNQNTIETSSSSQFLATDDIRLQTSTPLSTTDDTLIETNSDTILLTTEEETTNPVKTITTSESYTTEDKSIKWTTNQNTKETSSSSQILTTEDIRLQTSSTPLSTTDDTLKVTNSDTILLTTEEETTNPGKTITTSESYTTEDRSAKSTTNQNTIETSSSSQFLATEDITKSIHEKTTLASSIPKDGDTQWPKNQNLENSSANTLSSIIETETTNQFIENLSLANVISEGVSTQSTAYQTFAETSSTPILTTHDTLSGTNSETILLITEEETTNPAKTKTTSVSSPTEDRSTKWTPNQNTIESTSSQQFLAIEDVTKSSHEQTSMASAIPKDEDTQWPKNQNFENSSAITLAPIMEAETTNEFSKNLSLASIQSTTYQNLKETSSIPFSTTNDYHMKETNSDTLLITEDVTTNQFNGNDLWANVTTEVGSIQSTIYHNLKETTSTPFLTTNDHNMTETNSNTTLLITEDETTNQSNGNDLLASVTPEVGSIQYTTYQNLKETSSTPFSTTDDHNMKETHSDTTLLITEDETTNQSNGNDLLANVTTEVGSIQSTTPNASPSTTESLVPNNWTEQPEIEVTSQTYLLSSINELLRDKTTEEKLNTIASPTTSELLIPETQSEFSSFQQTSSTTKSLESTMPKSTDKSTTLFSSNTQSLEIETDVNTLPSLSTEITSTFAPITSSISTLSQISNTESSNGFSTISTLKTSENAQTNILNENLESTANPSYITISSKNVEENLSSTTLNEYAQSISTTEGTAKPIELSTTAENLFTTEIDTRLPVESSTASDNYKYQSIIPVSDLTNSVNTLLPAEAIPETTSENSQQISTSLEPVESKEYLTETLSTQYSSTKQTTTFIEPADSDKDDYSTEVFTTELHQYDKTTTSNEVTYEYTLLEDNENKTDSDQNINGSPQPSVELEISTIAIKPTDETFASNEYLEEPEYDPSSQDTYIGMAERCVCTGKRRYRNSCKKHYHCSKIGSLNRFIQSEIMECAYCFQFNAKKGICDFPENVPECAVDDGSFNRICTAEGNYSIPLERNCRKYYECKRNWRGIIALQVKICPAGRIFSERLQKCVIGCRCRNAQRLLDRCEYKNSVLPDRFDCSKYYYCNNEMEIKKLQCSDQYVFDGEKCELKSEVICDPSSVYRYLSDDDDCNR